MFAGGAWDFLNLRDIHALLGSFAHVLQESSILSCNHELVSVIQKNSGSWSPSLMSNSFQVYAFSWPRMTLCTQLWLRTTISAYTIFQWVPVHIHTPTCLLDQYCMHWWPDAWHLSSWRSSLETDSVKWALCTVAQRGGPKWVWPAISPWNGSQKICRVDFSSTWMKSCSGKAKTQPSCGKDVRVKSEKSYIG